MAKDNSLGGLFGKAKKWAQEELKNASRIVGTPEDHRHAEEANEQRLRDLEHDARDARDEAIVETLLPQGVKDWRADIERSKAEQQHARQQRNREDRLARAGRASMTVTGALTGSADDLAAKVEPNEYSGGLLVVVESIDPIPMTGGTFHSFSFEIPHGGAPGTYQLLDHDEFDATQYSLGLEEDNEGWYFHPTYGPGTITVTDGVADVDMVLGSSGSETIQLRARVQLIR